LMAVSQTVAALTMTWLAGSSQKEQSSTDEHRLTQMIH
jgi:hypothetical protein